LAADGGGFSRIAHGKYAVFIALSGNQSQKALNFNAISFFKVEIIKMRNEDYSESQFYYP
jgi:hypothetical protein